MQDHPHAQYYSDLGRLAFSPGWARPEPSMWPEPKPKFRPSVWRFAAAKRALEASHNMVPAEQTERRNLIMVNPIEGNVYATTRHLVAAYQCVMPGESARSHRHSATALRLVLSGKPGTYTVVNGSRIDMAPGDIVLTPAWSWHGHVNGSNSTSHWIDFLDIPFIQLTEAMFFEPYPDGGIEPIKFDGPSPMRIRSGEALGPGREAGMVEVAKNMLPTIGLHLIRQPAGGQIAAPRSTVNSICAVVSGKVRFIVENTFDETLDPGDVIAIPCWHARRIEALADSVFFRVSDEPLMRKLGLKRIAGN